jgi:glucose-1-phosphate thymidylyltransferase
VNEQENISKYGVIEALDGVVTGIEEKPREAMSHLVNTGVYSFGDAIFEEIEQETDLTSVIRNMISLGREVRICGATGRWLDVVYPWDMLKLNDLALANTSPATGGTIESGVTMRGLVSVGKGTIIRSNSYIVGPAIIGENCEIGPSACVLPSTSIADNVCISPFTVITNSVDRRRTSPGTHWLHDRGALQYRRRRCHFPWSHRREPLPGKSAEGAGPKRP